MRCTTCRFLSYASYVAWFFVPTRPVSVFSWFCLSSQAQACMHASFVSLASHLSFEHDDVHTSRFSVDFFPTSKTRTLLSYVGPRRQAPASSSLGLHRSPVPFRHLSRRTFGDGTQQPFSSLAAVVEDLVQRAWVFRHSHVHATAPHTPVNLPLPIPLPAPLTHCVCLPQSLSRFLCLSLAMPPCVCLSLSISLSQSLSLNLCLSIFLGFS